MLGTVWLWRANINLKSELEAAKTSKSQIETSNTQLEKDIATLSDKVNKIDESSTQTKSLQDKTLYYLSKLGDKNYTSIYNNEYTWYIAAEELGKVGKDAIPLLIENLKTKDVYEKSLTFYALQLASQNANVKIFTNGEYINVKSALSFDEKDFNGMDKIVNDWWEKYKGNW